MRIATLALGFAVSCGGAPVKDCSLNRLDTIKAEYINELVLACRDVPTEDECPAAEEARKRFEARKLEWATCQ